MIETVKITGKENSRLQHFRKVRSGKAGGEIFVEGIRLAEEVLRGGTKVTDCLISTDFYSHPRATALLRGLGSKKIRISETSPQLFNSVADTVHSQGLILLIERPGTGEFTENSASASALYLYLHEINDPSNLGAVFRTAEAAGASGVVLSPGSADAFSPKAMRAGMGSNLRLPVWEDASLGDSAAWMKEKGIRTVAADIKGVMKYTEYSWQQPTMLILGSEAHGLDAQALGAADEVVRIPMKNEVESLNLAVAAGIILFEAVRQRT